jgi:hypothetical protein
MQAAALRGLVGNATTPYQGNAPGGATSQGVAQLVSALLARKRMQQMQQNQFQPQQPQMPQMQPQGGQMMPIPLGQPPPTQQST